MNIKKLLGHRYEDQYTWGSVPCKKEAHLQWCMVGF
jgi:hypothetical protein